MINHKISNEPVEQSIGEYINRLYRVAVSSDPSPRSQIAYGAYLAAHGQPVEALHEFSELACDDRCLRDHRMLNEIIHFVTEIENRLEHIEPEHCCPNRPESAVELFGTMRTTRPGDRRRHTGHLLLTLAQTSCEQGWNAVAVASLRKAIRCFESAARMRKSQHRC